MNHLSVKQKIRTVYRQGLLKTIRITIDRFALGILRRRYGFHQWHTQAPLSARPYRRTVAEIVNAVEQASVVEVGCGLGVTLSLIKAQHRHGYDLDGAAIRAARLLRSSNIRFSQGDLASIREPSIGVLILVNWIHDISPEQLAEWLSPLIPKTRFLLLDAIDNNNPLPYRYKHDFSFLSGKATLVSDVRAAGEGRRFQLFEVQN